MDLIVTTREELAKLIDESVTQALKKFQPAPPQETKYVSIKEAAAKLKVAPLTLYRQFNANRIPGARRIGSKIKIPSAYLNQ